MSNSKLRSQQILESVTSMRGSRYFHPLGADKSVTRPLRSERKRHGKRCQACRELFYTSRSHTKTCSSKCRKRLSRMTFEADQ